jgi:hypothetical protein
MKILIPYNRSDKVVLRIEPEAPWVIGWILVVIGGLPGIGAFSILLANLLYGGQVNSRIMAISLFSLCFILAGVLVMIRFGAAITLTFDKTHKKLLIERRIWFRTKKVQTPISEITGIHADEIPKIVYLNRVIRFSLLVLAVLLVIASLLALLSGNIALSSLVVGAFLLRNLSRIEFGTYQLRFLLKSGEVLNLVTLGEENKYLLVTRMRGLLSSSVS